MSERCLLGHDILRAPGLSQAPAQEGRGVCALGRTPESRRWVPEPRQSRSGSRRNGRVSPGALGSRRSYRRVGRTRMRSTRTGPVSSACPLPDVVALFRASRRAVAMRLLPESSVRPVATSILISLLTGARLTPSCRDGVAWGTLRVGPDEGENARAHVHLRQRQRRVHHEPG